MPPPNVVFFLLWKETREFLHILLKEKLSVKLYNISENLPTPDVHKVKMRLIDPHQIFIMLTENQLRFYEPSIVLVS